MLEGVRRLTVVLVLLAVAFTFAPTALAAGSFTSSDPLLNEIWQQSVRTANDMLSTGPQKTDALGRPCAISLPVPIILDGVVRDRCPYIGDESVIDLTFDVSEPHFDTQRAMLALFAANQRSDGSIPCSPYNDWSVVLFDYNAYWITTLYNYVLYSGDVGFARQVWPNLTRLIDRWYAANTQPNGLLANPLGNYDYAFIHRRGNVVAYYNGQYAFALKQAVQLAGWVGDTAAASRWSQTQQRVVSAFAGAFWNPALGVFNDTTDDATTHPQDGNAFAVLSGAATATQATSALGYLWAHNQRSYGDTIVDSAAWNDPAWGTLASERVYPFMSFYELLAWFQTGRADAALNLIRREWGYMVQHPPGAMWETIGPYGGGPTDQHPSYDAGWSSGAAPALSTYVLGVQPTSPGFATFTVKPQQGGFVWGISAASGTVPTPHGEIAVAWKLGKKGKLVVSVKAPPGTKQTNAG